MKLRERMESIRMQFELSADEFCKENGGRKCTKTPYFKKEKVPEMLRSEFADIDFGSFSVLFIYTAHSVGCTSVLECAFRFGTEQPLVLPLPFAADFFDDDITEPFYIPCISDKEGMASSFGVLSGTVKKLLPKITGDDTQTEAMKTYFANEYSAVMGTAYNEDANNSFFYSWLTLRFTSAPYILALKGNTEKAAEKLENFKKRFRCENRLISLWRSDKAPDAEKIPSVSRNMDWYNDKGVKASGGKPLLAIILSWFTLAIPASAVYFAIYFIMYFIQKNGSVCLIGVPENCFFCLLAGFFTAVALSYFTRCPFYRVFGRKNYEKLLERDQLENGAYHDRGMKVLLSIVVMASVVAVVLMSKWNLNFKEDGFIDNSEFFSFGGVYYTYDEIERIRYVPDRENGYGETLELPSYSLVMKDGREIDLFDFEYDGIDRYDPSLTDFLREKGVSVENRREIGEN